LVSIAFNKLITVQSATPTTDSKGMTSRNWATATTVASNVPASIQQMSARAIQEFKARDVEVDYEIFTVGNSGALKGHRIPDPDTAGVYYIVEFNEDMGGRGRFYSIKAKRIV
jgi:hypothetical protein